MIFGLIEKMFIRLLTSIVSTSNHTKCVSLKNRKHMTQPSLTNLHPNEYSQELCYYLFLLNLAICAGSCSTPDELFRKACFPKKAEDLNLHVFNMITGINESRALAN